MHFPSVSSRGCQHIVYSKYSEFVSEPKVLVVFPNLWIFHVNNLVYFHFVLWLYFFWLSWQSKSSRFRSIFLSHLMGRYDENASTTSQDHRFQFSATATFFSNDDGDADVFLASMAGFFIFSPFSLVDYNKLSYFIPS